MPTLNLFKNRQGHLQWQRNLQQSGFSLIETLVVMAIVATLVILSFLKPNNTEVLINTATNALINTFQLARDHSVKHNTDTVFCIYEGTEETEMNCLTTTNWHNHWLVFADHNGNKIREENETILRLGGVNLSNQVTVSIGRESGTAQGALVFSANGRLNKNNTFDICLRDKPGIGRAFTFSQSGRYRINADKYVC